MNSNDWNSFESKIYKDGYDPMDVFYLFFGILRDSLVRVDLNMKWITLGQIPPSQ